MEVDEERSQKQVDRVFNLPGDNWTELSRAAVSFQSNDYCTDRDVVDDR